MIPALLNPKTVFRVLDQIDRQAPSHTAERSAGSRTALIVLFSVAIALLALDYLKNSNALYATLVHLASWQGLPTNHWTERLNQSHFAVLARYAWWSLWHAICFVAIPYIAIKFFLRQRMVDYGWRWNETHQHWFGYAYLLCPILVFVVIVSHRADFVHHYPFYDEAGRSWLDFLLWEALYLLQFACLEFFFRGYIVQSLRPHFGAAAIWIMIVPYLMIHFGKPWLEATGAIFFGLFLGILALRSRSIWGGFFVHAGVAVSMDIASLIQQSQIPSRWLPW
jgi:uncharacterized protein